MRNKYLIFFAIVIGLLGVGLKNSKAEEPYYDLYVEDITVSPENPEKNKLSEITVKIKNSGTKDLISSQGFSVYNFEAEDFSVSSVSFQLPSPSNIIAPGEYIYYVARGMFSTGGDKSLSFEIDRSNELQELTEENNSKDVSIIMTGDDLYAEDISIIPEKPAKNQGCIITIKIKNEGTKNLFSSQGLSTYKFEKDDFVPSSVFFEMPSLSNVIAPGEYIYYISKGKFLSSGDKILSFEIDSGYELLEENGGGEENNFKQVSVSVAEDNDIDLYVESIGLSKDKILIGDDIDITVTIKNIGEGSFTESTGLLDNDITADFQGFTVESKQHSSYPSTVEPLNKNGTFTYSYTGKFNRLGENSLSFAVDKFNRFVEANENNNATSSIITVYLTEEDADDFDMGKASVFNVSASSVMISWDTSKETIGRVEYKRFIYETNYENQADSASACLSHSVILENLKADTEYYYRVVSQKDTVVKNSGDEKIKTIANDSFNFTVGPDLKSGAQNNNKIFSWETNLIAKGSIFYKKEGEANYIKQEDASFLVTHNILLEDLEDGDYYYYIEAKNYNGEEIKLSEKSFKIESITENKIDIDKEDEAKDSTVRVADGTISTDMGVSDEIIIKDASLYERLKGKIILKVESKGEAYYINPKSKSMYYLGRPKDAFDVMRSQGGGITNANLERIQVAVSNLRGNDSDKDGLPDMFEDAIGSDKNKKDSDGDGFLDKDELEKGYSPLEKGVKVKFDEKFSREQKGKIFLQVESNGEAWYVNNDGKRYFLARPDDAFNIMRELGLGISNKDFDRLYE